MLAAQRQQVSETLEHVKAALVGFGIAKAREFMCLAIPGFEPHLCEVEQKHQPKSYTGFAAESNPGRQSPAWESDMYSSGGRDNSGSFGNSGPGSTGQTGYRGNQGSGEPVGSTPLATP
jgi:hypothetical protein